MNVKRILKAFLFLLVAFISLAFILAYYPVEPKSQHAAISVERAEQRRNSFQNSHHLIKTRHSPGVASAFCIANSVPQKLAGLVVLSGAWENSQPFLSTPGFSRVQFSGLPINPSNITGKE